MLEYSEKHRVQCHLIHNISHILWPGIEPKGRYTLVTLPRNVTPYCNSVDGTCEHVTYQKLVTGLFSVYSVFGRRIKGMVRLRPEHVWTGSVTQSPPPAAPVTNWERQCVTLAGYCYAVRHGLKVQLVTPYRVSLLQRYGVTVRGNVTSVYPP